MKETINDDPKCIDTSGTFDIGVLFGNKGFVEYRISRGSKNLIIELLGFRNILDAEYKEGIFAEVGKTITLKEIEALCNGPINNSHANKQKHLGPTSKMFDTFCKEKLAQLLACKTIGEVVELWKADYNEKQPGAIQKAAKVALDWVKKRDLLKFKTCGIPIPTDEQYEKMRKVFQDYLEHLVYFQTAKGHIIERAAFTFMGVYLGWQWRKSNMQEEAKGIDGQVGNYLVTVKPKSFFLQNIKSETSGSLLTYVYNKENLKILIQDKTLWKFFKNTKKGEVGIIYLNQLNQMQK